jgi:hypothetical protein
MRYSNLEKKLFLDIFSTNIDTPVPSLYQCVKTRSIQVFWLLSQALPHLRFNVFTSSVKRLPPRWNRFTRQTLSNINRKHVFMDILCNESLCPQKPTREGCSSVLYSSSNPASEHTHARLLFGLSWSWTVLLPSDTHGKPITSIKVFFT